MSVFEIEARPIGRGRYEAWHGGRYLCEAREPFLAAARILVEWGMDPDTLVTMRHQGAEHVSFQPMRLAYVASLDVGTSDTGVPRFVPFRDTARVNPSGVAAGGRPIAPDLPRPETQNTRWRACHTTLEDSNMRA